jgi:hypothetical protein
MTMPRIVAAEVLDGLPADDPAAMRSRADLRRVHRAMGTRHTMLDAVRSLLPLRRDATPLRVFELGAGDGSLMLGVAQELTPRWPRIEFTLLDRQDLVSRATLAAYADAGWNAVAKVADVHDWADGVNDSVRRGHAPAQWHLIVANLFLHHFEGAQLDDLLRAVVASTGRFFACEPRRAALALAGSHLVGAIGANAVTRKDAVLSVHAGFRGTELSALWPVQGAPWRLHEYSAGLFSHCLRAESLQEAR